MVELEFAKGNYVQGWSFGSYSTTGYPFARFYPLFCAEDDEVVKLDFGFLRQTGSIAQPHWNGVVNLQTKGKVNMSRRGSLSPLLPVIPPDGQYYCSGGVVGVNIVPGQPYNCLMHDKDVVTIIRKSGANSGSLFMATVRITDTKPYRFEWSVFGGQSTQRKIDGQFYTVWGSASTAGVSGFGSLRASSFDELCSLTRSWFPGGGKPRSGTGKLKRYDCKRNRSLTIDGVKAALRHDAAYYIREANVLLAAQRPSLDATAMDGLQRYDSNMLIFLSKLSSFGQVSIGAILDLARSGATAADLASFWLANRYGDRLSFSSFAKLVKAVGDELNREVSGDPFAGWIGKSRSTHFINDGYCVGSVDLAFEALLSPNDSNAMMTLVRNAYEWDWFPSMSNTWDAIPLSFVVEWFLNVGEIYRSIDRMVWSRYYDVIATLQSLKLEIPSVQIPEVSIKYYQRDLGSALQLTASDIKFTLPRLVNVIDGVSLCVGGA
jgi:hypothetical protein